MILNLFFYFIIFLFGLVIGSFLNCVIYRLYTREGFFVGRSHCPKCGHKLAWYDLIPLFSFIALRGRCRYCRQKISLQYPLVELATGIIFLLIFKFQALNFGELSIFNFYFLFSVFYFLLIASFLIIIFTYDLQHYIIPDRIIYPAVAIVFLYQLFKVWSSGFSPNLKILTNPLLSALFASAFFLAIVLASRGRWMGFGDVKLAFFMGLFLGFPDILVALFLAFFIGAIIGTGLIIFKKKGFRSEIPFGPFLVTGTLIAFFWGEEIINWYLSLMF